MHIKDNLKYKNSNPGILKYPPTTRRTNWYNISKIALIIADRNYFNKHREYVSNNSPSWMNECWLWKILLSININFNSTIIAIDVFTTVISELHIDFTENTK